MNDKIWGQQIAGGHQSCFPSMSAATKQPAAAAAAAARQTIHWLRKEAPEPCPQDLPGKPDIYVCSVSGYV